MGRAARSRGPVTVARDCLAWGVGRAAGRWMDPGSFRFDGREHECFRHPYHHTWLNERAVEVPVFRALVEDAPADAVLEVGNVLSHYLPVRHTVVDKYEHAPRVVNADALEYQPDRRFRLIVSISTLEHVGFEESPRDPDKPLATVNHLRSLLEPGGRLVFSVPTGYNPELDRRLRAGDFGLARCAALRRDGRRWIEVGCEEARPIPYDRLLYRAGAILIATVEA